MGEKSRAVALHERSSAPAPHVPAQRANPDPAPEPGTGEPHPVARFAEFCYRRLAGDYEVDEFGFDREFTDSLLLPAARAVYEHWFRVEVTGAERIPADGGALLVANHSGTLPWDMAMTQVAVYENGRRLRGLGSGLLFGTPVLGVLARKAGQTLACGPDAERLLRGGELVGTWPEGSAGLGKPFAERYTVGRFARCGFVDVAARVGVPIIPVSIAGAEEAHPKLAEVWPLARLFGLPYFPVTPTFPILGPLGAIPLPTKWRIDFGEPIEAGPGCRFALAERVRGTIQRTLREMLEERANPFTG
ncbi:lysophospholipid acyltransferase family protein [Sciscionella marina]|uniref:lysophospholipid acyltransferase family protein n=1 Tax=Sciscionella marina TaxID=508770 RepID=UPI0003634107|nr:lysophospholipid acyltransferase family protein [Sciscionella marina]